MAAVKEAFLARDALAVVVALVAEPLQRHAAGRAGAADANTVQLVLTFLRNLVVLPDAAPTAGAHTPCRLRWAAPAAPLPGRPGPASGCLTSRRPARRPLVRPCSVASLGVAAGAACSRGRRCACCRRAATDARAGLAGRRLAGRPSEPAARGAAGASAGRRRAGAARGHGAAHHAGAARRA